MGLAVLVFLCEYSRRESHSTGTQMELHLHRTSVEYSVVWIDGGDTMDDADAPILQVLALSILQQGTSAYPETASQRAQSFLL